MCLCESLLSPRHTASPTIYCETGSSTYYGVCVHFCDRVCICPYAFVCASLSLSVSLSLSLWLSLSHIHTLSMHVSVYVCICVTVFAIDSVTHLYPHACAPCRSPLPLSFFSFLSLPPAPLPHSSAFFPSFFLPPSTPAGGQQFCRRRHFQSIFPNSESGSTCRFSHYSAQERSNMKSKTTKKILHEVETHMKLDSAQKRSDMKMYIPYEARISFICTMKSETIKKIPT